MVKTYSRYTCEALSLLGQRIRLARRARKWTERMLAERAGLTRPTLRKIERGEPGCAIGSVFEVAALVGVALFDQDIQGLRQRRERTEDQLALLPQAVRPRDEALDDDF